MDRHFIGTQKIIMSPARSGFPGLYELEAVSASGRCVTLNMRGENRDTNIIHLCNNKECKKKLDTTINLAKVYIAQVWGKDQLGQKLTDGSRIVKSILKITTLIGGSPKVTSTDTTNETNPDNKVTEVGTKTGHHCMANILWTTTEVDEERCSRIPHAIKYDSKN